jgi:hypothetical protein
MSDYYFKGSTFVVEQYLEKPTFANFLPGLAGKKGIPLWAFYVNRGQGISGFGIQDKNRPIMEFTPANKAYESVGQIGFRTFLKVNGSYYEPFVPENKYPHKMIVKREGFDIEEINPNLQLKTTIQYFGLPQENLAGLIRRTTIVNESNQPMTIELLDGIAEILPAGVKNGEFKAISNLLTSWMDVDQLEDDYAFYKLRSSTADESEVVEQHDGNFLFSIHNGQLLRPIVDQDLIFGYDNSKRNAVSFQEQDIATLIDTPQVTVNKLPCGFAPLEKTIQPTESIQIDTVVGYTHNIDHMLAFMPHAMDPAYITTKAEEAASVIDDLLQDVETHTGRPEFDEYVKQNYLDNLLRGGYPYPIGDTIYHLYSRRHGDLERDYNFFSLAPEYYSNGAGNFRDVCQNRRMDSAIHRDVKAFNIKHFASLIQLDGFNPLAVNGMTYTVTNKALATKLIERHFASHHEILVKWLLGRFTPGGLVNFVENEKIPLKTSETEYLNEIITASEEHIESAFGEGYWADHFTYILDLVESYEAIYPDKVYHTLFQEHDVKTFDSPVYVLPKTEKSVLNKQGQIRQYGSLIHEDHEKIDRLKMNKWGSNWATIGGETYYTNLYTKLLLLVLNKHSNLDPDLIGVEMEANKPGWNDAMNGVPGLFGSGVGEVIELLRIVEYLSKHLPQEPIDLPAELFELFAQLSKAETYQDLLFARHQYRKDTRFGLTKEYHNVSNDKLSLYFEKLVTHINEKLELLYDEYDGIIPTFLVYEVTDYKPIVDEAGNPVIGHYGLPLVEPKAFNRRALPKFLEAPARLLRTNFDSKRLTFMVHHIKETGIYDDILKMYKTSDSLDDETMEIGRVRAFTKGWLERESNFLHMTYKYLLGLQRAGLYDQFFQELEDNLVCFMDPARYKRSTLENSSFIAPSNNPNPHIHGQGFFARLSGSTVEVVNMWYNMMTGGQPFKMLDGNLMLQLEPTIPASYFKDDKTISFTFLQDIEVTYVNPDLVDTYRNAAVAKYELSDGEETVLIDGAYINGKYAAKIREGLYTNIKAYITKKLGGKK